MAAKKTRASAASATSPKKTTQKTLKKAAPKSTAKSAVKTAAKSAAPKAAKKPVAPKKPATPFPERKPGEKRFWLMKSEPESYSIDAFALDKKTLWTGVRNYLARNFMMTAMAPGDRFFFYHSNAEPSAIVGVGEILRINQPDVTALDPKSDYHDPKASEDHPIWFCAEVGFIGHVKKILALADLKDIEELRDMALLQKGQRLSVQPVTPEEFETVLKLAGGLR